MKSLLLAIGFASIPSILNAGTGITHEPPSLLGVRVEFIFFALTLTGVAFFHKHAMLFALFGLGTVIVWKFIFEPGFDFGAHFLGNLEHEGEWKILINLLGLLFGFGILAKHFELSGIPGAIPAILPGSWKGGIALLLIIFVISSFLDNIAAAIIGGTIAHAVYNGRVHISYLAAIIAASNAGGSGSVVGDTTTMMMWIEGVHAEELLKAYIGAIVALAIFGVIASVKQQRHSAVFHVVTDKPAINLGRLTIVLMILASAIIANWLTGIPALGVWLAIITGALFIKTPWEELPKAVEGTIFLVALVFSASFMPVDNLPAPSWQSAFAFGFVSAFFDNIPLTKLCLEQGGYDWGILAFTVGFGGSMVWFGSSAGVALSNLYPGVRNTPLYLKNGWHIALAYVVAFFIMLAVAGWQPNGIARGGEINPGNPETQGI